jgi:hypothetical protein
MSTAETITSEELEAALSELGVRVNADAYFPELGRNIFEYVKAHREPEYEPGGKYEDPDGVCLCGMTECGDERPGHVRKFADLIRGEADEPDR